MRKNGRVTIVLIFPNGRRKIPVPVESPGESELHHLNIKMRNLLLTMWGKARAIKRTEGTATLKKYYKAVENVIQPDKKNHSLKRSGFSV
jgi:hypothetical protein